MPPLYAHCLGRFSLIHTTPQGHPTPIRLATDRTLALLATLLHHAPEPQRRDYLAYLMWPERPEQLARQNFRKTLSRLRQSTAPHEIILSDYHTVQLNSAVIHSDVAEFRQALAGGKPTVAQLTHAADLYQGEFLHGFHLDNNPAFGEWLLYAREGWQRHARETLQELIHQHIQAQQYPLALPYAQRYVQMEPWDEAMHRTLLTTLAATGQRREAITLHHAYVANLQTELGISPEPETVQLAQQLAQDKPLTAAPPVWHGFPSEHTTFVGRTAEIEHIHTHLTTHTGALVTITGMGGMGKTRLACQVAQSLPATQFPDGIYFVDCTAVSTPADFLPHLISQLGLELDNSRPTSQQLAQFLGRHPRLLLLLDNFEQLSGEAAELLTPLRRRPTSLLITSRHALNLQGEHRFSLGGLLEDQTGENLFMHRARRYGMTEFSDHERQQIAELVQLVAGMPLAIEMATAWLRAYNLPTLLQSLRQNLAHWVAPHADLPPRHQSLRAVFAGSWALLPPNLQQVWARLSLLQGQFTAEAAHHIGQASFLDLAQLVDRSLFHVGRNGRYQSHPLLRQWAQEKLATQPEEAQATAARHAQYYLTLLIHAGRPLRGAQSQPAVAHIRAEFENIRAAWLWAQGAGYEHEHENEHENEHANEAGLLLGKAARPWADYFLLSSLYEEGAALLQPVDPLLSGELWLERDAYSAVIDLLEPHPEPTDPTRQLRRATLLAAAYYGEQHWEEMHTAVAYALPLAQQQPTSLPAAYFYIQAAYSHLQHGAPAQARHVLQQALPIFYEANDLWGATKALYASAVVDGHTNQNARPHFLQILHLQRQIGSLAIQRHALTNLTLSHMLQGEYAPALTLCQEAYALCQRLNHEELMAENRLQWGRIHTRMGLWAAGETAYQAALALYEPQARPLEMGQGLVYTAVLHSNRGEPAQALATSQQARLWAQQGPKPWPVLQGMVAWSMARAWVGLGQWADAVAEAQTAVAIFHQRQMPGRWLDARAILAYAQAHMGHVASAVAEVGEILAYRAQAEWLKTDDPFFLEFCCVGVLGLLDEAGARETAAVLSAATKQAMLTQMAALDTAGIPHGMGHIPHWQPFLAGAS